MIASWFLEGGYGMWVMVTVGVGVLAVAAVYAAGQDRLREATWALVGLAVAAGAAFMLQGRALVERAVENVDPQMRARIVAQGYAEAQHPLELGVGIALAGAAVAGVGELRRRRAG
jgi:heme O synthase-like polyprenyltransferase